MTLSGEKLKTMNQGLLVLFYAAFIALIVFLFVIGSPLLLPILITDGIGFVAVSLFRRFYNAPRPYEVSEVPPAFSKDTSGKSFPSRHGFSAFMIAFSWLFVCLPVGLVLVAAAALLSWVRVTARVHFPRDVIAAAVIAALFAAAGILPFYLFFQ